MPMKQCLCTLSAFGISIFISLWPVVVQAADASTDTATEENKISEIVVTAEKKSERLADVPIPISVINPDSLVESNQTKLSDYYTTVPGIALSPQGFSPP